MSSSKERVLSDIAAELALKCGGDDAQWRSTLLSAIASGDLAAAIVPPDGFSSTLRLKRGKRAKAVKLTTREARQMVLADANAPHKIVLDGPKVIARFSSAQSEVSSPGRPRGGRYKHQDDALAREAVLSMAGQPDLSPTQAARMLGNRIPGNGTLESREKRLARKIAELVRGRFRLL